MTAKPDDSSQRPEPVALSRLPAGCAVGNAPGEPLAQRTYPEEQHPYRSPFQRDRARIIHSRAFRRLAGKTQVFGQGSSSDHIRSRLTHTMEVAQLARMIAIALGLNEDLTEALALVHDIGHPPFGHAGERALDQSMQRFGLRFDHNLHALRIVEFFEQRYAGFRGLNLTLGVREGIVKHSRDYSAAEHPELGQYFLDQRPPLEAQIIDLADEIAYLTADFDDGFEAGVLQLAHVRDHVRLFERFYAGMAAHYSSASPDRIVNETLKRMLNALTGDLITETNRRVRAVNVTTLQGVRAAPERLACFSPEMESARHEAKQYLHANLYSSARVSADHTEAERVITSLFRCWVADPGLLPSGCASSLEEEGVPRTVADYIAGMTDSFILAQYAANRERCV